MPTVNTERYSRARASLEGLSVGDAFGGYFFGRQTMVLRRIKERILVQAPWHYSDDTEMALSIVSILRQCDNIDQDQLALSFGKHYDRSRGYGPAMRRLLPRLGTGSSWKEETPKLFSGQGSFGNGGAMRVAPLGAYFADDLDAVVEHARRSAEVTHAHPEGVAGAIAVAIAAAYAWRLRGSDPLPDRAAYIDLLLPHIPDSVVREKVRHARDLASGSSIQLAVAALGNGSAITAQDTVGFTVWCAGEQLGNYEEALWLCASGGGDVDTTCAIVGGIVASHTGIAGIPAQWISNREQFPDWPFQDEQ